MSCSCGTLSSARTSAVSSDAQRIGSAPAASTSPRSALPPVIFSLSMASAAGAMPFFRRQRLHRQGVDFGLHPVAEGGIDQLVASDRTLAGEGGADDDGFEVLAVAA